MLVQDYRSAAPALSSAAAQLTPRNCAQHSPSVHQRDNSRIPPA